MDIVPDVDAILDEIKLAYSEHEEERLPGDIDKFQLSQKFDISPRRALYRMDKIANSNSNLISINVYDKNRGCILKVLRKVNND